MKIIKTFQNRCFQLVVIGLTFALTLDSCGMSDLKKNDVNQKEETVIPTPDSLQKQITIFNLGYYSFRGIGVVACWQHYIPGTAAEKTGINAKTQAKLLTYLKVRDVYILKTNALFPHLKLTAGDTLFAFFSSHPDRCLQSFYQDNSLIESKITAVKAKGVEVYFMIGSMIGLLSEMTDWADISKEKPVVQGISEIVTTYSSLIPESIRKPMTELSKFEGQKISPATVAQIQSLTEQIFQQINSGK